MRNTVISSTADGAALVVRRAPLGTPGPPAREALCSLQLCCNGGVMTQCSNRAASSQTGTSSLSTFSRFDVFSSQPCSTAVKPRIHDIYFPYHKSVVRQCCVNGGTTCPNCFARKLKAMTVLAPSASSFQVLLHQSESTCVRESFCLSSM